MLLNYFKKPVTDSNTYLTLLNRKTVKMKNLPYNRWMYFGKPALKVKLQTKVKHYAPPSLLVQKSKSKFPLWQPTVFQCISTGILLLCYCVGIVTYQKKLPVTYHSSGVYLTNGHLVLATQSVPKNIPHTFTPSTLDRTVDTRQLDLYFHVLYEL